MATQSTAPQFQSLDDTTTEPETPELFDPIDRFPSIQLDPPPRDPHLTADMMTAAGCFLSIAGTVILGISITTAAAFRHPLDTVAPGIITSFALCFGGLVSFALAFIADSEIDS